MAAVDDNIADFTNVVYIGKRKVSVRTAASFVYGGMVIKGLTFTFIGNLFRGNVHIKLWIHGYLTKKLNHMVQRRFFCSIFLPIGQLKRT